MAHPEWIDKIKSVDGGWIKVQKVDKGVRVDKVDQVAYDVPIAVIHTTEGYSLPNYVNGTPTMDVGPYQKDGDPVLRQLIPFGYIGTALKNLSGGIETNRRVLMQLEQVAFSSRDLWLPPKKMVILVASLAEWLEDEFGIQQKYPYDPAQIKTGTWATSSNPWRNSGKFASVSGWHPHAAVPENDHWDCGAEDIEEILGMKPKEPKIAAYQLMAVWKPRKDDDHRKSEAVSPHFSRKGLLENYMVRADNDLRPKVWKHLKNGHKLYIAERQVAKSKVEREAA